MKNTLQKPQSMFRKMHLMLVALVVLMSVVVLFGALFVVNRAVEKAVHKEIETEYQFLLRYQADFKVVSIADAIDYRISPMTDSSMIYLLQRSDGSEVVGNLPAWPETVPKSNGWYHFEINEKGKEAEEVLAKVIVYDDIFPVLVGRRLSVYSTLKQEFLPVMMVIIALLAAALTFLVFRSNRYFSQRVKSMNTVLSKVKAGQLNQRITAVETEKTDELAELSRHINTTLDENIRLMLGLEAVSQTSAHEINKELSHLRDLAQEKNQLELVASANSLLRLLSEILELSKIESSTDARMTKIDLKEIALSAAKLYQDAFDEANVELIIPTTSAVILGQSHLLTNAVANLLNNALKHTPVGGTVVISISAEDKLVRLSVTDTGEGTDSEDLAEILQYAQQGKVAGYGFGLRFVQAVSIRHGAKLQIENTSPGFKVSLTFPVKNV